MFKIHPNYYLSQATKARDPQTFMQCWINYCKTSQLQSVFITDRLLTTMFVGVQDFYKQLFGSKA